LEKYDESRHKLKPNIPKPVSRQEQLETVESEDLDQLQSKNAELLTSIKQKMAVLDHQNHY